MSYVIVQPFYGAPIAHHPSCYTLKKRSADDEVDEIPVGAVRCVHCLGLTVEERIALDKVLAEKEETGFIVVRPPNAPPIAHHPLCRTLTSRMAGQERYTHQRVERIPTGVRTCNLCKGLPPKPRVQGGRRVSNAKPVGKYFIGKKGILVPHSCPQCGSAAVDRDEGRMWICFQCDWMGSVNTTRWTKVESTAPRERAPESGRRAVPQAHPRFGGSRSD